MALKLTEIQLLENELWWGGAIHDGVRMPYGAADVEHDLRNLFENSGAPFLVSNRGRYIWQDRPFRFEFRDGTLSIDCEETVNLREGRPGTLKEAFREAAGRHFPAQGRTPDPLAITAPQYCTWMEMHYEPTQQKTMDYAREIIRQGFPPGVLIIDDNWMEDYGTWRFHPLRFPDPKQMTDALHDLGFKVMLWVCPYVSPDSQTGRQLEKKGLLVADEKGKTALRRWWNGCSAVLDYTFPESRAWFKGALDELAERYGIDGFKFDAGDPADDVNGDWVTGYRWKGTDVPNEDCAAYSLMGLHYPLSEYRASWKAGGAPLMQRLRDKPHSWGEDGIRALIPNSIAQGLVGFAFNCPDMVGGGWDGDLGGGAFDPELFVRYAQCSALFPMMQFSTAPWKALDQRLASYCLEAARLRERLGAELLSLADEAAREGTPILRAMAFEFPEAGLEFVKDQYMVGSSILAAPVLGKGETSREIAFPDGIWQGEDGSRVEGPIKLTVQAPLSRLPWYRREASSV
ncbi:glycoside hydrolase family 31 protein [Cohnella cellulosilytica]|uniref:Glycoside hydrolase family 31 protein n=1 Tax=Cohnella cellulosilytica TaxID=986710 RepID=A0ABW2FD01_9BACL